MSSTRIKEARQEARILATGLREEMGLKSVDSVRLHTILRKKGIIAVIRPLEKSFSGMALKASTRNGSEQRFMLVNSSNSYGKQRFTVCHELYHLLFQEHFDMSANNDGRFDEKELEEYKADVFAAYLLLPELGIESMVPACEKKKDGIRLETVLRLEHHYRCSRGTLLRMLKEMGWISSTYYNTLSISVMRGAVDYGYSLSLYKPTETVEVIGDYNVKARRLLDDGRISLARYHELLEDLGIDREVTDEGQ